MAFTIPNLFRRLLGEGALTAAFIPVFKEKEKIAGEKEMWRAANAVISGLVVASAVVIALVLLGVSLALNVHEFQPQTDLMLRLLRWMFPYMLLVCVAAAFMGMLNARGHFFIPAMGATMLNIVMIASVLFLAPRWSGELHDKIFALAVGVLVAGVAQALFQVPTLWRDGFRYQWVTPWGNETVARVVRQMIPGAIGVAAFQLNVVMIQGLGLWLDSPERPVIASYNYAVRLMELPQGLFGISLATFLLPTLSGLATEKNWAEFRSIAAHRHGAPAPGERAHVGVAHHGGGTDHPAFVRAREVRPGSHRAGDVRAAMPRRQPGGLFPRERAGPGVLRPGDTRTPMKISIACLMLNLVFALILVWPFRQGGFGLANTISSAFNVTLLLFALRKKLGRLELGPLKSTLPTLAVAAVIAIGVSWWGTRYWEQMLGHETLAVKIGAVFVPGGLACVAYWLVALGGRVPAARELTELVLRTSKRR